jgi:malate synthase
MTNQLYTLKQPLDARSESILTPGALDFLVELQQEFGPRIPELMEQRQQVQAKLDAGGSLDFLPETKAIRESDWTIKNTPQDLLDRRVEITGPVDRKMVINALNSGARVFMADFEDAHSPDWQSTLEGQINLRDAIAGTLSYTNDAGKHYSVDDEQAAILIARVRGWHLSEKNLLVDDERMTAALFDFGLYLYLNYQNAQSNDKGLYFYLPKMEHYLEARLWAEVFAYAEDKLGLEHGSIKCTVLIETIPAAFQMDEILFELRDYIVGLNAGRWDYIFSVIKRFRNNPDFVLPDRAGITMETNFLRAYSRLLIKTCHQRGAHAMGGMAAQIPIKRDPQADTAAKEKVRLDKIREATDGHDGTWVAHPGLVPIAMEVFDEYMPNTNQINKAHAAHDMQIDAAELLDTPKGDITEAGFVLNITAALHYIAAWLGGRGAVPIFDLMEDAATAEISRAQLWQWVHNGQCTLSDGTLITADYFSQQLERISNEIALDMGEDYAEQHYPDAANLLGDLVLDDEFVEFLTLPAYELID